MAEPTAERAKIQSLEGLRGVLAWWVVLGHISLSFGWHLPLIDRNALAVDVFILLSGFVIARLIDQKREHYGQYLIRRAFRLFPLYLIVLAVSTLLLPVQLAAWSNVPFDTASNVSRVALAQQGLANLPAHLGAHVPLFQGVIPQSVLPGVAYTIVGQAWSISLEWQFYLLAPLFMWALLARRRWPLMMAAVIALHLAARPFSNAFLGAKILLFCIGMCCYLALERRGDRRVWSGITIGLTLVAVAVGGALQVIPLAIWSAALLSSVAPPAHPARWLADALSSKLAVHFGEISYSLYLVHMIPLYGSIYALGRLSASRGALQVVVPILTLIGAYLIARVTFAAVEKPGIAFGAKLARHVQVAMRQPGEALPVAKGTR